MELNPVLLREVRARWRKWPAFALVFGYAIILAIGAGWAYGAVAGREIIVAAAGQARSSSLGAELFHNINILQAAAWLLIAPLLTVSSITSERANGLLDQLHTSPLSPWQIAAGKLGAALSFILLILLVPLPVVALCFLLGGVSPGEFIAASCLQATFAAACAANGLLSSALAPRTASALAIATGLTLAWMWGGLHVTMLVALPLAALAKAHDAHYLMTLAPLPWALIVMVACLKCTAASLLKPPSEVVPYQPSTPAPTGDPQFDQMALAAHAELKQRFDRAGIRNDAERRYELTLENQGHSPQPHRKSVPLRHWLRRLKNPLLGRDLHEWLRRIRGRGHDGTGEAMFLCVLAVIWITALIGTQQRVQIWFFLCFLWMPLSLFAGCLMGALGLAREREQKTLHSLFLTRLRPVEIIVGKGGPPLMLSTLAGVIIAPVLITCLDFWSGFEAGIAPGPAISSLWLIAAVAWSATMFGLCCGWFTRSTLAALATAIGVPFVLLAALPILLSSFDFAREPLAWWHPFIALWHLSGKNWEEYLFFSHSAALLNLCGGGVLFLTLLIATRHGTRQK